MHDLVQDDYCKVDWRILLQPKDLLVQKAWKNLEQTAGAHYLKDMADQGKLDTFLGLVNFFNDR
jgi:hypothetical protein